MSETRKSPLGPAEIQLFVAKDFLDTVLVPGILRSDVTKETGYHDIDKLIHQYCLDNRSKPFGIKQVFSMAWEKSRSTIPDSPASLVYTTTTNFLLNAWIAEETDKAKAAEKPPLGNI